MSTAAAQSPDELRRLKELIALQEKQIASQEKELEALRAALEGQKRVLMTAMSSQARPVSAEPREAPPATAAHPVQPSPAQVPPERLLPLNASQEVRFSPTSPTLKVGPADVRLQGYIALTGLFDSAN